MIKLVTLLALAPIAIGPLPGAERTLTLALCLGGEITIPLGDKDDGQKRDCHLDACHAGNCREKEKLGKR